MMPNDSGMRALSGLPLAQGPHVRFIYVDEAGTSANEPATVVVGVIVHADEQLLKVSTALKQVIDVGVPPLYRENFVFHALEIFNGGRRVKRDAWPFQDRLNFFKEIVNIPFAYDLPLAVATGWRGAYGPEAYKEVSALLSVSQYDHVLTFAKCLDKADLFLRKYLKSREVGTVVAEDVPEIRRFLSKGGMIFRDNPHVLSSRHLRQDLVQKSLGIVPGDYTYQITNIVDCPHFVQKDQAPMIQLADACAFVLRRWLCRKSDGEDLMFAMLGPQAAFIVPDPVWLDGPGSSALFNTASYQSDI